MPNFTFSTTASPPVLTDYYISGGYLYFTFWENISAYTILHAASDNYLAIWADSDASLNKGKIYVSTNGELSIIDMRNISLYDRYDVNNKGRGEEVLSSSNVFDINIV